MRKAIALLILAVVMASNSWGAATHTPVPTPYVDVVISYTSTGTTITVATDQATAVPLPSIVGVFYGPVYNKTTYPSGPVYGRADYEVLKFSTDISGTSQVVGRGSAGTSPKARKAGTYVVRLQSNLLTFTPTETPVPATNTPTPNGTQTFAPTSTPTLIDIGNGVKINKSRNILNVVDADSNTTAAVSKGYVDAIGNTTTAAQNLSVATEVAKLKAWAILATPIYY